MKTNLIVLSPMPCRSADFVQLDGIVFETDYLRIPDESTVADDVVIERATATPRSRSRAKRSTTPSRSAMASIA